MLGKLVSAPPNPMFLMTSIGNVADFTGFIHREVLKGFPKKGLPKKQRAVCGTKEMGLRVLPSHNVVAPPRTYMHDLRLFMIVFHVMEAVLVYASTLHCNLCVTALKPFAECTAQWQRSRIVS